MDQDFTHATLGRTGLRVCRLGLSASYWPGRQAIHRALDAGVNYFFAYGFDFQMVRALRDVFRKRRDGLVLATGGYNWIVTRSDPRRALEKRLRQFRTDYIDVFLFLGVTRPKHLPERILNEMRRLREEGRVRAIGISCHNRKLAGRLLSEGALDVAMIRYNAAHRGAETEIFPYLASHNPGIVSYTATRWRELMRRPKGWPKDGRLPTAAECYRFVLSNPHVHVCMTAPSNIRQLEQNLEALRQGPLSEGDMEFMREFGDAVHAQGKWFM
jgi:aryl-alcohol dehydrogenase-like predicted oxidoreductase